MILGWVIKKPGERKVDKFNLSSSGLGVIWSSTPDWVLLKSLAIGYLSGDGGLGR